MKKPARAKNDLYENALTSIRLGIEDYQSNDPDRPISAVRNFFAGVVLLGKQCLLAAAPNADPNEVLASDFVPTLNSEGGVSHRPRGHRTVDLSELKSRFKGFGLKWPDGDIGPLQDLRNNLEHYSSPAPRESIRQVISSCFPLVEGFFSILKLSPAEELGDTWRIMLEEEEFFRQQKEECNASFSRIPWFEQLSNTEDFQCEECYSSLIYQEDEANNDPASVKGRCRACGVRFSAEKTISLIVEAEFGVSDYVSFKDGGEPVVSDCNECGQHTYVCDGETNLCFLCGHAIEGDCARCSATLGPNNQSVNNPNLCDYCDHVVSKDD